ncbi:MAG TPA: hypothetical protein VGP17_13280 [Solirubrobacteraceae bacterium]|jgi:hypothetical protein|nr:hypothetical protein [Solirubrobacteraceae bacterium]
MSSSNALLPIVVGVGLTVLSGGALAERRGDRDRPRWDATLFFFLAVQLIGFCVVGAALYVLGWSIETSQPLGPQDLRAEKHFIMALLLLFVITAIFKTWTQNVESPGIQPWERGYPDRAAQLLGFTMALLIVVLVGLGVDESLISSADVKNSTAVFLIGGILVVALGFSWVILRRLSGGDPSPKVFFRSRRQQQKLLRTLDGVPGQWITVKVRAIAELDPPLALSAMVWVTRHGWYWVSDTAYELQRYHVWAANHALLPTKDLHTQWVSVFAGPKPESIRGMRIIRTAYGRPSWRARIKAHRQSPPPPGDASAHERDAGLVCISPEQLRQAGLQVITDG